MYQNIFFSKGTEFKAAECYIWDDEQGMIVVPYSKFNYAYKLDKHGMNISIYGQRLKKVYKYDRNDQTLFESDVPRETRILTDLYLNSDEPSKGHRVLFFDIEVRTQDGLPDVNSANKAITAISAYDTESKEFKVFGFKKDTIRITNALDGRIEELYTNERDMLEAFLDYYCELKPTIITGWNIGNFDIPYLYRRLARVFDEVTASKLSPIFTVMWRDKCQQYQIAGVSVLDYLELYKKFTYTQQPSYRLDSIGELEVGIKKVSYDGTLEQLYQDDYAKFLFYNYIDTKIVVELDKKMKLIELVRSICHVGHVPYEEFIFSSRFIEGTILCYLHRKNIIAPNKAFNARELMQERENSDEDGFEGAFVKEPVPGLYDWVYSLDLQSLYPSLIMTLNISIETKVGSVLDWNTELHAKRQISTYHVNIGKETKELTREQFDTLMQDMNLCISGHGIIYTKDKKGIIPEILEEWFKLRKEYKDLMKKYADEGNTELKEYYDRRQHVQKIFLNSVYGTLGLPAFRFYDLDNALSVTISGQDVIKMTGKYIQSEYENTLGKTEKDYVLYSDTDSCYASAVPLLNKDEEPLSTTITLAKNMETRLNEFYKVMAQRLFYVIEGNRLVIKGESVAETAFWAGGKKRYALKKVYDLETNKSVDKMVIKGLDVVRSSFPAAFRDFMKYVLKSILDNKNKDFIDAVIMEFVNKMKTFEPSRVARNTSVKVLSDYEIPNVTDLTIFKSKTPMQVRAALIHNRLIKKNDLTKIYSLIGNSEKIKYVYLKENPYNIDVIAFKGYDDPPIILDIINKYIDYDMIFEKELKNKLQTFYESLRWGSLPIDVNQSADQFFSF